MNYVQAFQALRSSSRSFASRHVAGASLNAASRRIPRYYSTETAGASGESKKDGVEVDAKEADEVSVTPEHELLEKFKQKEAEVTDLKVCVISRDVPYFKLTMPCLSESATLSAS